MSYIPSTNEQRKQMLAALGFSSYEQLYVNVPKSIRFKGNYKHLQNDSLSEFEVKEKIVSIGQKNKAYKSIFRGAGAYNHYIPSVVGHLAGRSEFITGYTPYQPEMSQGILQVIFEFQTVICNLTGLDISNASMYDGSTAAAEAISMCVEKNRRTVIVSQTINPSTIEVIRTYCKAFDITLVIAPEANGKTDLKKLAGLINDDIACVYVQTPNYYGLVEDGEKVAELAHAGGAKFVAGVNPLSLAVFKTPAEYGADIAVGEGQPLGIPLSFGGPYLGFIACKKDLVRRMPGRIVGLTKDKEGKRALVLTLQAREQHIRREKALSNICTNAALCALTATIYCSAMGPQGLTEVAEQSMAAAAYLKQQLDKVGFKAVHKGDMFHEFVTDSPVKASKVLSALDKKGILGGLELAGNKILWCATEVNTKKQIDELVAIVKEVK